MERKLTAILCADVFGYSRLMGEDEEATHRILTSHRKIIDSLIEQHHGRFVNSAGDSVLAEFASVVNAVQCAVDIQTTLKVENANLPPERRMEFRIGVNSGDVIVDGEQIYGDGVNVAARLESLAEPGGICISGTAHDQLGNKLALGYDDLGDQSVKNIAKLVRVFRVLPEVGAATIRKTQRVSRKYVRRGVFSIAGLAIIAATIVFVQHLSLRPPNTTASIPPAQHLALPLPSVPSIAVLPFTNMSGDPSQEYFSDGITEDLITALSGLPGLFVIARNSAFTYKGKAVRVQDVSRELGVKYVLEGSVQRADNQVRITAQLVDATTGVHIWAERYDRPLHDIFSLQDEIVRRIVTTLNLALNLWAQGLTIVKRGTDNLDAYDCALHAHEYEWTITKEGVMKARQMWEKAIQLDPKYATAYSWLAYNYQWSWAWQWDPDPHAPDRAFELAQRAVALDPSFSWAHAVLSIVYSQKGQHEQALAEAEQAIVLDPNSAGGYRVLAIAQNDSGKPAEAVASVEKAMRLDPRLRDFYLDNEGFAYTSMGRYNDAAAVLKPFVARYPNILHGHLLLAIDYSEMGRDELARAEVQEVLRINPEFSLEIMKGRLGLKDKDQKRRERHLADLRKAGLK